MLKKIIKKNGIIKQMKKWFTIIEMTIVLIIISALLFLSYYYIRDYWFKENIYLFNWMNNVYINVIKSWSVYKVDVKQLIYWAWNLLEKNSALDINWNWKIFWLVDLSQYVSWEQTLYIDNINRKLQKWFNFKL